VLTAFQSQGSILEYPYENLQNITKRFLNKRFLLGKAYWNGSKPPALILGVIRDNPDRDRAPLTTAKRSGSKG
jgi:hypothetical protein